MKNINKNAKTRRKIRIRAKIKEKNTYPRISIFRSNKYIYAQTIDDEKKITLVSFSSLKFKNDQKKLTKKEKAKLVGKELAKILKQKKITQVVFDRGSYAYKGQVKSLAEGLREEGIKI